MLWWAPPILANPTLAKLNVPSAKTHVGHICFQHFDRCKCGIFLSGAPNESMNTGFLCRERHTHSMKRREVEERDRPKVVGLKVGRGRRRGRRRESRACYPSPAKNVAFFLRSLGSSRESWRRLQARTAHLQVFHDVAGSYLDESGVTQIGTQWIFSDAAKFMCARTVCLQGTK